MKAEIFSWDWKAQPPWEDINDAVSRQNDPVLTEVDDTGGDMYVLVVSDGYLTRDEIQFAFKFWWSHRGDDDE